MFAAMSRPPELPGFGCEMPFERRDRNRKILCSNVLQRNGFGFGNSLFP